MIRIGREEEDMSVSVHAISMIYELRALRSRLSAMLAQVDGSMILCPEDLRNIEWSLAMTEMLISKTERTGEYIGTLERALDSQDGSEEAGLGT